MTDAITSRRASSADVPAVLELARAALGWTDADARFLEWKHRDNPFGESPMWVAEAGGRVVGFRTFLRWELTSADGRIHRVVRAVDTATAPDYQGRGIFTRLTLEALPALRDEGVEMVFNTPNDKSRPGYLKMGWQEVGRLRVLVRPNRWRLPVVLPTARRPATRAAVPTVLGTPASEALADPHAVGRLLARVPHRPGLATRRSPAYLAWRFANPTLGYRVVHLGSIDAGCAVFRLRRRGSAVEAVLCELMVPDGDREASRALVGRVAAAHAADYLIRLGSDGVTGRGFVRLPLMGPVLACLPLDRAPAPPLGDWALTMGDIELL